MEELPASLLQAVLSRTDAVDCARAACVNRRWRSLAYEDSLWSDHCARKFGVSVAQNHEGKPCCSFKETYAAWFQEFSEYSGLVSRTKTLWDDLRTFLRSNYPAVADSLRKRASEADIVKAEQDLGWQIPPHARLLYRFCDGQEIFDGDDNSSQYLGLLGGYYFYNHFVNVQLLPLDQVVKYTKRLSRGKKRILVAASCNLNKFFLLDCEDGLMYVGTKNYLKEGEVIPCLPGNSTDGMLLWLEEYRNGLLSGKYKVRNDHGLRSISLFPETEPLCTEAVTYGVQVRCSSVFVPELSDREDFLFTYCVRMRFLPVSGLSFNQCQLMRRHWIISQEDVVVDEARGEAVVGMFPLLKVGGDVFVYESCTSQNCRSGSMEGDLTFVPGCLTKQEGAEFLARIARFPLQFPQYIF